jgi:hypothetical protein
MKKIIFILLILALVDAGSSCSAQTAPIPAAVTGNFSQLFPNAGHVEWLNKQSICQVFFTLNEMKCEAKFQPDGKWLSTERQILVDSLPKAVKDGLHTTPYADWSLLKAFLLALPGNEYQYKLVVSSSASLRKRLSFDQQGKLIKE